MGCGYSTYSSSMPVTVVLIATLTSQLESINLEDTCNILYLQELETSSAEKTAQHHLWTPATQGTYNSSTYLNKCTGSYIIMYIGGSAYVQALQRSRAQSTLWLEQWRAVQLPEGGRERGMSTRSGGPAWGEQKQNNSGDKN